MHRYDLHRLAAIKGSQYTTWPVASSPIMFVWYCRVGHAHATGLADSESTGIGKLPIIRA
jgi:hypothetical protein